MNCSSTTKIGVRFQTYFRILVIPPIAMSNNEERLFSRSCLLFGSRDERVCFSWGHDNIYVLSPSFEKSLNFRNQMIICRRHLCNWSKKGRNSFIGRTATGSLPPLSYGTIWCWDGQSILPVGNLPVDSYGTITGNGVFPAIVTISIGGFHKPNFDPEKASFICSWIIFTRCFTRVYFQLGLENVCSQSLVSLFYTRVSDDNCS